MENILFIDSVAPMELQGYRIIWQELRFASPPAYDYKVKDILKALLLRSIWQNTESKTPMVLGLVTGYMKENPSNYVL